MLEHPAQVRGGTETKKWRNSREKVKLTLVLDLALQARRVCVPNPSASRSDWDPCKAHCRSKAARHGHTACGFDMTFPLVFMLPLNQSFTLGEIGLKGVPSSRCIQLVWEPGLGCWEQQAESWTAQPGRAASPLIPPHAQRQLLCSCANMTLLRFQRSIFIYGSCMNCTPQVTCKNLQRADDLNTY